MKTQYVSRIDWFEAALWFREAHRGRRQGILFLKVGKYLVDDSLILYAGDGLDAAAKSTGVRQSGGLKPHLEKTLKVSNDPHFEQKLCDVVGLYVNPAENAVVFCVDEKTSIQALDRTQPGLPIKKGRCGTVTHDYKTNGTGTLVAALDVATGSVTGECYPKHTHNEFLKFLKKVESQTDKNKDLLEQTIIESTSVNMTNNPCRAAWIFYTLCMVCFWHMTYADKAMAIAPSFTDQLATDYRRFAQKERLARALSVFSSGALLAHSAADRHVQIWYQSHIRTKSTDNAAGIGKQFGEGTIMVPVSLLAALIPWDGESNLHPINTWGRQSLRAYLTGTPALLLMQRVTGASRPGESDDDSQWRPFHDSNGVSGHAFVGAVPFLTLAQTAKRHRWLQYGLVTASTLTGISRVNDDAHYSSQAILGWYLAWEAVDAVHTRPLHDEKGVQSRLSAVPLRRTVGVRFDLRW